MSSRKGLVSYAGDSEISDSEDERVSTGNTPPGITVQGLGIPLSRSSPSPQQALGFQPLVVEAAPSTGLVAYYGEEDEDVTEGKENENDVFQQFSFRHRQSQENKKEVAPVIDVTDEELSDNVDMTRPLFLSLSKVQLPPEPPGRCSRELEEKIAGYLKKKEGMDLNRHLQERKDLRNPSIYEKLVEICKLDQFGTNYPEHLFNPHEWDEESHYDKLLTAQKKAYEKKEKARLDKTKIEFVTGTKRPAGTAGQEPQKLKQRKSKWDVSTDSGSRGSSPSKEKASGVGAQALAQASQLNKELSKLAK